MNILKKVAVGLVVLVVVIGIVSLFLPSEASVARTVTVDTASDVVFEQVNHMSNWENWGGPWQVNRNVNLSFDGEAAGVGSILFYDHEVTGKGSVAIIESVLHERLKTEITFSDQTTANGNWRFVEDSGSTEVTWRIDVDLGRNPVKKILGRLMIDGQVGPEFEQGLARLKEVAEAVLTN